MVKSIIYQGLSYKINLAVMLPTNIPILSATIALARTKRILIMIEVGFGIYNNIHVVAIEEINGSNASIRYIQRNLHDKKEVVALNLLTPFTHETAKELRNKYNKYIGESNMRIHAIDECLRYMT